MSSNRRGPPSAPSNRPLYAIDFTAVACGKRIANTKRRVRWRFGFGNTEALSAGETGTACRGEEHDITLVWSITSGKRLILADGREIHFSNSRSSVIDYSWTMRGNHVLKVVAQATPPMSADSGLRQYDFFVDGRSFFSFPKVYRLGLTGNRTRSPDERPMGRSDEPGRSFPAVEKSGSSSRRKAANTDIQELEMPHNHDEEEAYLREAIKASIETEHARVEKGDDEPEQPKLSAEATSLLIDFMGESPAANGGAPVSVVATPASDNWALAPVPANQAPANQWAVAAAPPTNDWAAGASQQPYDQFQGSFAAPPPVAQQPVYGGAPSNSFAQAPAPVPQQQPQFAMSATAPPSDPFTGGGGPPSGQAFAQSDPFTGGSGAPPGQAFAQSDPYSGGGGAPPGQAFAQSDPFAGGGGAPPAQAFAQAPAPVQPSIEQQDPFGAGPPPNAAPASTDSFAAQQQQHAAPVLAETPSADFDSGGVSVGAQSAPKLTMHTLNGNDGLLGSVSTAGSAVGGGSMVDQAVLNLMGNIDSFGITGAAAKPPDSRKNPFNNNSIVSNTTLGELKASSSTNEKKSIMNAPPGALVVAGSQSGNWGGYGGQQPPQQQQQPMAYGGQMGGGAPPMQQQPMQYGMAGGYQQQQQPPPMAYGGQMGAGAPPMQQQPYGDFNAPPQQPQGMYQQQPQYQQQQQQQYQQPQWGGAPSY